VLNTAIATGDSPDGEDPRDEASETTAVAQTASLSLVKTSDKTEVRQAGEEVEYTLTVTNTGNVTLTNVTVVDPLTGLNQNAGTLNPGASAVINTTYVVTQADVDSGSIANVATATGKAPNETTVQSQDEVTIEAIQNADIDVEITDNDAEITKAGQEIVYTITVTNTGNVTLENVTIVDSKTGLVINIGTLKPGESKQVNTDPYVVTQEDVDKGSVPNDATATGESPSQGDDNPSDTDEVVTPITPQPSIVIEKTSDKSVISKVGELVTYTLTVSNTGNVTLTNISVTDPLTGLKDGVESLEPGQSVSFQTVYTVTVEDLARGKVINVGTVKASTPSDEVIGDDDSNEIGVGIRPIIANNDDYGSFFLSYGGLLGNILDNDLLDGVRPNAADVDFEFTDLDGIIGLLINENGELSLTPGVNEIRAYTLKYTLREVANPNNRDDATVVFRILNNQANLKVDKTSKDAQIFEGDEFTYEIRVSNIGSTPATNVEVVDNLPQNVTYLSNTVVSVSSPQIQVSSTVTGSSITWKMPFLPAGGVVVIQVKVKAGAAGTVTNTAKIESDEDEIDPSDNQDTDVNEIEPFRIPNVITPNNDGDNDTFEIQGLGKFASSEITIFNRYGDHVFERKDYKNDWNAPGLVAGTYFYVLTTVDSAGKVHEFKGWIQVIKD